MAKKKSFFEELSSIKDLKGLVTDDYDPFAHTIETISPSLNFTFGKSWGLPLGYTLALWGPQKSGKSLIANMFIAKLHADDPDACALKFNTERRERLQFTPQVRTAWGIDNDRYGCIETNQPSEIFDRIESDVPAMIQKGHDVKLVVIDSMQGIQGRRDGKSDSVNKVQRGDHAATIGDGMKRILQVQRDHNFALIIVCQARMEQNEIEIMRGNNIKMAAPMAVLHHAEYFMLVTRNDKKDAREDELGNQFVDKSVKDLSGTDKGKQFEQTGHKILVCMKDSTPAGAPKGRVGEITLDYHRGVINVHEEVARLAEARGVLTQEGKLTWRFGDTTWAGGWPSVLAAIKEEPELARSMIREMKKRDMAGAYSAYDRQVEAENADSVLG